MEEGNDGRPLKLTGKDNFTPRQREIAKRYMNGQSMKEIAEELGISEQTVKLHLGGSGTYDGSKSSKGVYGLIEESSGERPHKTGLAKILTKIGWAKSTDEE